LWKFATHTNDNYHDFTTEEAAAIRSALLTWYRANRRKLPWRGDPGPYDGSTAGIASNSSGKKTTSNGKKGTMSGQRDIQSFFGKTSKKDTSQKVKNEEKTIIPVTGYSVWVSEVMLQQTRVEAVIKYYLKWMESFPSVHHLANATEEEVNAHWAGLGFYRRARLLHQGAKFVVNELDGKLPETVDELLKVSGIGRYTASAISSIAYGRCVPVVDGNVCRVLSRLKGVANNIKAPIFKDKIGWRLAEQIVTAGDGLHAGEVNQAMMELGATYCAPTGSGVDKNDPLVDFYVSTKIGREVHELIMNDTLAISDFVSRASLTRGVSACKLCEEDGITSLLFQLGEDLANAQVESSLSKETASIIGHSKFPMCPPKKAKREETLGVAVLSRSTKNNQGDVTKWFMVKRPSDGLLGKFEEKVTLTTKCIMLYFNVSKRMPSWCIVEMNYSAGQWEFPSACIWSSATENKSNNQSKQDIEAPILTSKHKVNDAISCLLANCTMVERPKDFNLQTLWHCSSSMKAIVNETPMEHIFSHVRWTMYCQYSDISSSPFVELLDQEFTIVYGGTECECRWMTEHEMQKVGITSSVKKILSAVKSCHAYTDESYRKRKR
jgi:A/G-specific adenine glycosylase